MNREDWLTKLNADYVLPHIASKGGNVAFAWRVSCGFPGGGGGKAAKAVGQCWPVAASADSVHEIYISPTVASPHDVAHILLHESIHASVGLEHGHKAPFKRLAEACGLSGKMTATVPSAELAQVIANEWLANMPAYPHAALTPTPKTAKGSRLLKATCETCGYTVRVTRKWLDDVGPPTCGNLEHGVMLADYPGDGSGEPTIEEQGE